MKQIVEDIKNGIEIRQNLIKLKEELKLSGNRYAFLYDLDRPFEFFSGLLNNEDAKVRKNTALILGELGDNQYLSLLYSTYKNEQQRFVKSAYLKAISKMDYRELMDDLKTTLEELKKTEADEESKKHVNEQKKMLSELIISAEGISKHEFTGYDVKSNLILITNRNYTDVTKKLVNEAGLADKCKMQAETFPAGVKVLTDNLRSLLGIRTYHEMLFILDDLKNCENEPEAAAKAIAESSLLSFLTERHEGSDEYYFRLEYKSKLELDKRSAFAKKFSAFLEEYSHGKFINSTSNYEVEIRLIESKQGGLNVLIKLYTIKDERFAYRVNSISASINPAHAAMFMELSGEYLGGRAKVLDPFCGVGTMLIERNIYATCNTIYGIDKNGEAIDKARENTEQSGAIIHYINRDFFDFKHEHLFDEIVTNMPRITSANEEKYMDRLYRNFILKAPEHLVEDGIMVIHSYEPELVDKYAGKCFERIKKFEISKKESSYLYILKKKNSCSAL